MTPALHKAARNPPECDPTKEDCGCDGGEVTGVVSVAGTTRYALDKASRRTRIDSPAGTFGLGYCAWNGKLAAVTNAHGLVMSYAYDVMDRVTNITWTAVNGASLGGFTYAYDAAGRIVSLDHALGNSSQPSQLSKSSHKSYAYDNLDRLAADGDVAYTYDAAGNRMTRTENGETIAYTLGVGDRLASWTGGSYTYNAAGCVTRIERNGRPTLDLTWNSQYQLASVSTNGVFAESYAYDALGRRVSTTTLDGTVCHIYDDSWQCLADIDENGTVLRSYVWGEGIDNLLAVRIGTETYMALTDIQGTVWGYVDSQNNIVARWTYDAWGNGLSENVTTSALASVRYRFQGRERSQATGLTNFRMRWYDSETGRWLSKDPIGLGGGLNSYEFCEASPLINMDCFGEDVYVPDNSKHGQPHVDRYHGSQNIGRYRKDGTGIPHKGKMPPRIPMSERGRFLAAASKLRCAGNILAWIPGILDDIDRISRAKENGRTYKEQLDKELDETQYLDTPFGIIPNPCYKGPLML